MSHWRIEVVLLCIILCPVAVAAAPEGKVVIAQGVDPTTLDMTNQQEQPASNVGAQIFESLLERDQSLKLVPALAAEMPKLVAPTTWEVKLRRGVKFHNGEEFTAESVKFTIERVINSKLNTLGKLTWPPSFGQEVQIVDPYTVRITSRIPDPMLPSRLAAESMNMAPPKALADYREKFVTDRFIGTGPFRLAEYVVGDRVVVEANPGYWGPKPPSQRIVWQVIPDAATRLAALQRGDVDV